MTRPITPDLNSNEYSISMHLVERYLSKDSSWFSQAGSHLTRPRRSCSLTDCLVEQRQIHPPHFVLTMHRADG